MHRSLLPLLLALAAPVLAHDVSGDMAKAAGAFLDSLTPEQKAKAVFPFQPAEGGKDPRLDWHYIPRARQGLPIKEMTEPQRALARKLLFSGLSDHGAKTAETIQQLELVLKALENGKGPVRDPENYFVSVFGAPGGKTPWGWRWEGHHQSFNYTLAPGQDPAMTPSFFGSNPGEVKDGPQKGTRPLAAEEDLARALVKSLTPEQLPAALIMKEPPKDILNVPGRTDFTKPEGLAYAKLNESQQKQLVALVKTYLFRCRTEVAEDDWAKVQKQGLENLTFAWAGGLEPGQGHYYRVQAGHFVLEYDNTQNGANHPHTVWRDFDHDFGADVLRDHYQSSHGAK